MPPISRLGQDSRLSRIVSRCDTEILDSGHGEKRHTIYYMNIEVGRNRYYLRKRYTDFQMLHEKLCEQHYPEIEDFDFPKKRLFKNFADSTIEHRRIRFEAYLTLLLELVNRYSSLRKDVEAFLGVPSAIIQPKRYPKTPIPGHGVIEKPPALLDDSISGSVHTQPHADTKTPRGPVRAATAAGNLNSPIRPPVQIQRAQQRDPNLNPLAVLGLLGVYIIMVAMLAVISVVHLSQARLCSVGILGLSGVALFGVQRTLKAAGEC